ncbi:MAG TPA: non-homologous end-joining DNA ligase, partial [Candidatus Polarisedimenticolaceae bacterium]|nr:non-homologous end-joining DNA ligase [Candidatus Polarisedimenticolaceae bacterium]
DITKRDTSVLSGRRMDQISKGDAKWLKPPELDVSGAPKKPQPDMVKPMLASLAAEPFDDPGWLYEIKWDGYRIMGHIKDGAVRLQSRGEKDYTQVFKPVATELRNLKINCVLDGEVVVLDKDGRSDFGALQNYQKTGKGELSYMVFDVPYAAGHDLRGLPLTRRKEIVAGIMAPLERVRYSDHIGERGQDFFGLAKAQNLEGIMAKDGQSTYQEGKRTRTWLKLKTHMRQEAVIGGLTEPRGSRKQLGALVLGVYDDEGKLRYIGHTGGGLNDRLLHELYEKLKPLERETSPFADSFKVNAPVTWVEPTFTAEVDFAEWTGDGHMRQPIFVGLREDKDPKSVKREVPSRPAKKAGKEEKMKKQETSVELSNLDKIYWPEDEYTKGDLITYYDQMADTLLPYL